MRAMPAATRKPANLKKYPRGLSGTALKSLCSAKAPLSMPIAAPFWRPLLEDWCGLDTSNSERPESNLVLKCIPLGSTPIGRSIRSAVNIDGVSLLLGKIQAKRPLNSYASTQCFTYEISHCPSALIFITRSTILAAALLLPIPPIPAAKVPDFPRLASPQPRLRHVRRVKRSSICMAGRDTTIFFRALANTSHDFVGRLPFWVIRMRSSQTIQITRSHFITSCILRGIVPTRNVGEACAPPRQRLTTSNDIAKKSGRVRLHLT